MTLPSGTMTGGVATAGGTLGQTARQQVIRKSKAAQEFKLALPETGSFGPRGSIFIYKSAEEIKGSFRMRK
jgi:hypothetical protein